jgi:hypothetical protein
MFSTACSSRWEKVGGDPGIARFAGAGRPRSGGAIRRAFGGGQFHPRPRQARSRYDGQNRGHAPATEVSDRELQEALSQAKPGMLKKPVKRIPAIALLGRSRRPEALGVLLQCLGDKEALVFRAAETALEQYVSPPPPPEKYEPFLLALFEDERLHPRRRPGAIAGSDRAELSQARALQRDFPARGRAVHFRRCDGSPARVLHESRSRGRRRSCGAEGNGGEPPSAYDARMAELEKKRVYLEQRRQWIQSGKQGPPPEPPQ